MSYRATVQIHFCYGHRLLDYEGPCAHPHGHNGLAEIELETDALDRRGMVVDFGDVKSELKSWIDRTMDHQMILRRDDPLVEWMREHGEPLCLFEENPTAENIARTIFEHARAQGWPIVAVQLWETPTSFASYTGP